MKLHLPIALLAAVISAQFVSAGVTHTYNGAGDPVSSDFGSGIYNGHIETVYQGNYSGLAASEGHAQGNISAIPRELTDSNGKEVNAATSAHVILTGEGSKATYVIGGGPRYYFVTGDKTVTVEYSGDDNYTSKYTISNFTVDEAKVVPDLSVVDLGNGTVVVIVGDNATGNVTVSVGGQNFTAEVINGTAYVTLNNVTPGSHDVEIVYSGDDTHEGATTNVTVEVPKLDAPISVDVGAVTEGEVAVITVTVPVDASGNVTVYVDGQVVTAEVVGGVAVVEVSNLTAGDKTTWS